MSATPERLVAALADRYRIDRELGAGGMATVHLAHDLRNDRQVAIKVLRPELAAVIGAERFLSEIKTTANLQHPHILPLHDSGQADSFLFYVMPYVTGESLRDRLDREKQLPIADALRIATEVAGALDYAHRRGIIHRDIKPENILLEDGGALIADFGIALAATGAASRMTETGMSLGTPHYMSPEQAMGDREITARSDVYSLGATTYEMLLGEPPFTGPTAQSIVAKVMTEEPSPIVSRRRSVPEAVEAAIFTALDKLPADRFASTAEFAAALAAREPTVTRTGRRPAPARRRVAPMAAVLVAIAVISAAAGWMGRGWTTRPEVPQPIRFSTTIGRPGWDRPYIAISADGRKIVQTALDSGGTPRLMVRDLSSNTVASIAGTEGAWDGAEFSADGEWLLFVVDGVLKKISVRGGPSTILVDSLRLEAGGVAWSPVGDVIFSVRNRGLWRLPASGGVPVQLTRLTRLGTSSHTGRPSSCRTDERSSTRTTRRPSRARASRRTTSTRNTRRCSPRAPCSAATHRRVTCSTSAMPCCSRSPSTRRA